MSMHETDMTRYTIYITYNSNVQFKVHFLFWHLKCEYIKTIYVRIASGLLRHKETTQWQRGKLPH